MNDRDSWTVDAMERYGGSFIRALANLARFADSVNLEYIKDTWTANWNHYEDVGMKMEQQYSENRPETSPSPNEKAF